MSTIKVDTLQTRAGSTAAVTGAGSLKVDNLRGNTAAASITLGDGSNTLGALSTAGAVTITGEGGTVTTNLQQGLAKAWLNVGTDFAIDDSINISATRDDGTGLFDYDFTNNMVSVDYSPVALALGGDRNTTFLWQETTSVATSGAIISTGTCSSSSNSLSDNELCVTVHGDLA